MFKNMDPRLMLVIGVVALLVSSYMFATGLYEGGSLRILLGGLFIIPSVCPAYYGWLRIGRRQPAGSRRCCH